jgi:hypothetical protein
VVQATLLSRLHVSRGSTSTELRRERDVRYRVNIGNGQQMLIVVFRPTLRRWGQFIRAACQGFRSQRCYCEAEMVDAKNTSAPVLPLDLPPQRNDPDVTVGDAAEERVASRWT